MIEEPDGVGGRPACIGDVCITCSDTAVEVRVLRLLEDQMAVELLDQHYQKGDIVHVGTKDDELTYTTAAE